MQSRIRRARMRNALGRMTVRSLAVLLVGSAFLPALSFANEKVDKTFDLQPGQRVELSFDDIKGEIDIEGWDKSQVQVQGSTSGRDWREGEPLDFDLKGWGLQIAPRGRYHDDDRVRVRLTIMVPQNVDLQIDTITDLRVTNVEGDMDVSVGNADVEFRNVKGSGRVAAANGRMNLIDCQLDAEISNVNGRLRMDGSDIRGEVSVVNASMDVSNAPEGIDLSSVNGNIDVGKANEHVQVTTTNGNVHVDDLDGWIEAETINGSVHVRFTGLPEGRRTVDIETVNGNVELEIPENFSLDFDVRVESSGDRHKYDIDSDFELQIEEEGSRRGDEQRLTGRGKLNDGAHRVRIRTTNGDVVLKRLASSR